VRRFVSSLQQKPAPDHPSQPCPTRPTGHEAFGSGRRWHTPHGGGANRLASHHGRPLASAGLWHRTHLGVHGRQRLHDASPSKPTRRRPDEQPSPMLLNLISMLLQSPVPERPEQSPPGIVPQPGVASAGWCFLRSPAQAGPAQRRAGSLAGASAGAARGLPGP
jgi:hypothetical protein